MFFEPSVRWAMKVLRKLSPLIWNARFSGRSISQIRKTKTSPKTTWRRRA
jgi:hypothetical protein